VAALGSTGFAGLQPDAAVTCTVYVPPCLKTWVVSTPSSHLASRRLVVPSPKSTSTQATGMSDPPPVGSVVMRMGTASPVHAGEPVVSIDRSPL
jgi:hypothetical protein